MKGLLDFFINHVFTGVFQYDSGPPEHALELKNACFSVIPLIFTFSHICPVHIALLVILLLVKLLVQDSFEHS